VKILTCVKHVPTSAVTPRISGAGTGIEEEGLSYEVNEPDLYAIEEALYQRSIHGGSVTAVTVGPARAKEAIHVAYAKGVDQGIHVVDEVFRGTHSALSIRAVAELMKKSGFDLIFTGIQADDDLLAQFGILLAEELQLPVITAVTEVRAMPSERTVTVIRELGGGYKEELVVSLPCVLTIQFGIRPVRYTPIMAIVKARAKKIESIDASTLGLSMDALRSRSTVRVVELSYPKDSGNCEFLDGPVPDMVNKLVDRLAKAGVM
jgi:electron transfer flavoprotein beta subunit